MVGGLSPTNSSKAFKNPNVTGLFIPSTGRYCHLPPLPRSRASHTVNGLTACRGSGHGFAGQTCETFNTSSGQWETSYTFDSSLSGHVAWQTSRGLLLMGGFNQNISDCIDTTTLLLPGGGHQQGPFNLIRLDCTYR